MKPYVPEALAANCRRTPEGRAWLTALPDVIRELETRWALQLDAPFDSNDVTASWVAPARRSGQQDTVLKIGFPHMEAEHEALGLRFWDRDPTVELVEWDDGVHALLLERCVPGTALRGEPESVQDEVIASLLRRLWRKPGPSHSFRPLSRMLAVWAEETRSQRSEWPDEGLVRLGLSLFAELAEEDGEDFVLATDLHAGNVLRAEREAWLVIDPKPFVGDPAYDTTQHLFNGMPRLLADPLGTIEHFAHLVDLPSDRVRLWTLARAAAEPRADWDTDERWTLAEALAP